MELLPAHQKAMAKFDRTVALISGDQWQAPTPCTAWTVRDLLNHLVSEQLWAPLLLDGATIGEVGDRFNGDQLGADPKHTWAEAARAAREAWTAPGATERIVHLSYRDVPASEYGWQMTLDLAVHDWDLAKAIGKDQRIEPELSRTLLTIFEPELEQWRDAGIFAPPVPVPPDSDVQDKLLALLGRDPH